MARIVSDSCHLARTHRRSDSRFKYCKMLESSRTAAMQSRSARRTTARATSATAETRLCPGTAKSFGISKRDEMSSIASSRSPTIAPVIRGPDRGRSGLVASSVIASHSSRDTRTRTPSTSEPGSTSVRSSPMNAWASSTAPYALGRTESFATRPPPQSTVVPASPFRVYTFMVPALHRVVYAMPRVRQGWNSGHVTRCGDEPECGLRPLPPPRRPLEVRPLVTRSLRREERRYRTSEWAPSTSGAASCVPWSFSTTTGRGSIHARSSWVPGAGGNSWATASASSARSASQV